MGPSGSILVPFQKHSSTKTIILFSQLGKNVEILQENTFYSSTEKIIIGLVVIGTCIEEIVLIGVYVYLPTDAHSWVTYHFLICVITWSKLMHSIICQHSNIIITSALMVLRSLFKILSSSTSCVQTISQCLCQQLDNTYNHFWGNSKFQYFEKSVLNQFFLNMDVIIPIQRERRKNVYSIFINPQCL